MFIVELEPGVWIEGVYDPRTVVERNAKVFRYRGEAVIALQEARRYRPFLGAKIMEKK